MARTINEITLSISAAIDAVFGSDRPNSPSSVSVFKLLADVSASVSQKLETLFDRHMADVDAKLAKAQPGTAQWYADRLREFRQGDVVQVGDDGIRYPVGSTGLRLITQATAKENEDTKELFIKIATDDANAPGGLRALTEAEKLQVRAYLREIKFPGMALKVESREADQLRLAAEVYYDPLLEKELVKQAVVAAVRSYLKRLEFDGVIFNARLEDAIQAVPGVKDVRLLEVSVRNGQAAATIVTRAYETQAGYIVEDDEPGSTLSDTLQLLPYGRI
ncbi:hypothetical protein [Hymenobacter rubripertinctus]|uniref:Baseplate J-like C-terminal domain-containing protein n=1 Tax=Hymenobacter rubripertinctus TaxID=2029981 RepID=A0A418QMT3_9BACT|nr:hypothetical protein [Hymenobacter rubripertinctus]RIY06449.1 hypothetical protein D0T11_18590 [Hymenobacter rubripertinctus]